MGKYKIEESSLTKEENIMKYGYRFYDWGLYEIEEILEISELTEDYITVDAFGTHVFHKEDWVIAKVNNPKAFIHPEYIDNKFTFVYSDTGPYYKKHIFDTAAAADEYGRHHSMCFIF